MTELNSITRQMHHQPAVDIFAHRNRSKGLFIILSMGITIIIFEIETLLSLQISPIYC